MGHNPSRNPFRRARQVASTAQYEVDQYKAQSIWGGWRGLVAATRSRYFNVDEIAWLNRYGSRLDQLACLTVDPRNEREKAFVKICLGHAAPTTDRHRLWLRAQMVVRYESSLERAALCGAAEQERDAILAKCRQLEGEVREWQMQYHGSWAEAEMRFNGRWEELVNRRRGLANVSPVLLWSPAPRSPDQAMFDFRMCQ